MKKTRKSAKRISADTIARLADQGKDVSHFFKGEGEMVQPILEELDRPLETSTPAGKRSLKR